MKEKTYKKKGKLQTKTMVMMPYVGGFSEAPQGVIRRKHYKTIKQLLVHPKDKRSPKETADVVYSIPCKDCDCVYVGETGRRLGMREKEDNEEHETAGRKDVL